MKIDLSFLNDQQREAVMSEQKRILVLAAAGSGKTKTLVEKLTYLIQEKGVNPQNILAITFTKNAANEMHHRFTFINSPLADRQLSEESTEYNPKLYKKKHLSDVPTIKNFHSFCFEVLKQFGANQFDNKFKIILDKKWSEDDEFSHHIAEETIFEVLHKITLQECEEGDFLLLLKRYIIDYYVDKIDKSFEKKEATSFREHAKYYTTLNGISVRSKSEQYIADWLYRHKIYFEYEPTLNVGGDFDFHPDFFIPDADLYIEHTSNQSYEMKGKEWQFRKGKLLLVKTYESMTKDSHAFNIALERILKNRLPAYFQKQAPLSFSEEFNTYNEYLKLFLLDVLQVIHLLKVENKGLDSIFEHSQRDQHERVRIFYTIANRLIQKYHQYCVNKSYLDFEDLISTSIQLFKNNLDIINILKAKYKYILVDEFQDVNTTQIELLKILLTPESQLFCVGDDWQSVYSFRGADVHYIIDFEKYFPPAQIIKLNLNYRSTQNIVEASNEVIKHNKLQVEKHIYSSKTNEHKIVIFTGANENDNIKFCIEKIKQMLAENVKVEDILLLYRRTDMFTHSHNAQKTSYKGGFAKENISIPTKTIHSAKGMEAKVVFVIGLNNGYRGFPDIWMKDRIFQVIKKPRYESLLEEERRLFYVAITRAKEKLFLITEKGKESVFLKEIPEMYTVKTSQILGMGCPKCFSELEPLFTFCPYCGTKVEQSMEELV
ncbi:MAG: UvrD-helicase domain-containing protein [Chitinophagaceae bacterium]|nr:UvrD-helicase domain-containing protein [Chitinophagaceae bacterium]